MSGSGKSPPKFWIVTAIVVALILNYILILHVEIVEEVQLGRPALQAVLEGDVVLTFTGIAISVIGVAWILNLLLSRKDNKDNTGD